MFDSHESMAGIMPYLFGLPTYSVFVWLGIFAGIAYYMLDAKRKKSDEQSGLIIALAAIISGMAGSKIPAFFETSDLEFILYAKSIVGGFLGGLCGVILAKKLLKIKLKLGNIIAPAAALGMSIGRLGCFFNGCCYGIKASWGFDFGDGYLRLPTQLFEAAFHLAAFLPLHYYKDKVKTPGILFKLYVFCYFVFRFFTEFLREHQKIWLEMSIYQIICALGAMYLLWRIWRDLRHDV